MGADGVWSKVRPLVSDATPVYAGMSYIDTFLRDVEREHSAVARMVGEGALYALVPGKGFLAHREAGDVAHTYVVLQRPLEWFADLDLADTAAAKERLAREFRGWSPELTALITDADSGLVLRAIHELPDGHRWDHVSGVTLLGDAAHATLPGGDGANLAMLDGALLADAIAAGPDGVEAGIGRYEEAMFERSAAAAIAAHRTIEVIFGAGAPAGLVRMFTGRHDGAA